MCIGGGDSGPTKAETAAEDRQERLDEKVERERAAQIAANKKAQLANIDRQQKEVMQQALAAARVKYGEEFPLYADALTQEFADIERDIDPLTRADLSMFYLPDAIKAVTPQIEAETQATAVDALKDLYPSGWEQTRITGTEDDPILAAINEEQFKTAKDYVDNLLARDVITPTGQTAAMTSLSGTTPSVLAQLEAIGSGAIATGRGNLTSAYNTGLSQAQDLGVGETYNPATTQASIDTAYNTWLSGLEQSIRGALPPEQLYKTAGLPVIAGAAFGSGSTFDPKALAGIFEEEEEEPTTEDADRLTATSIF